MWRQESQENPQNSYLPAEIRNREILNETQKRYLLNELSR